MFGSKHLGILESSLDRILNIEVKSMLSRLDEVK